MNEIVFHQTSNVFLNSGIVALHWYLEYRKDELGAFEYTSELSKSSLRIWSPKLFELLEEVYYMMGREVYDTSGKNARKNPEKFYFKKDPFEAVPFYKMKTYGLGELITNDPTPRASRKGEKEKFGSLYKRDKVLAEKVGLKLHELGKKLKFHSIVDGVLKENDIDQETGKPKENRGGESEIFFEDSYTKLPDLEFENKDFSKFLKHGNSRCSLTGEGFEKLTHFQNVSPFVSDISNFNSFNKNDKSRNEISWKAKYLALFSPKLCLYGYTGGLNALLCFFFNSDSLINIYQIYQINRAFYKDELQLIEDNYISNINIRGLVANRKDGDAIIVKDYAYESELLFLLVYDFYKQFLFEKFHQSNATNSFALFFDQIINKTPISLIVFRADKFASTMRTSMFEEFNNFKFSVSLIHYLEKSGISFLDIFSSLKFIKPAEKKSQNSYQLERKIRSEVINMILYQKSILSTISLFFYQCYLLSVSDANSAVNLGYKKYSQLKLLVELYEPIIQFGGNQAMNKEIQEKAINLGTSIGQGILLFSEDGELPDKKKNARNGRRYIIGLYKARNLAQFKDAIIRIMNKYKILVSKDILLNLDSSNFESIKQFAIMSALNQINSVFNQSKNESK